MLCSNRRMCKKLFPFQCHLARKLQENYQMFTNKCFKEYMKNIE